MSSDTTYTPQGRIATLEDWTESEKQWKVMLHTSEHDTAATLTYLTITKQGQSLDSMLVTAQIDGDPPEYSTETFKLMDNGQIYGAIPVPSKEDGESVPMYFVISMVIMENSTNKAARYLSSITLVDDPETAGVMGAEEEDVVPNPDSLDLAV